MELMPAIDLRGGEAVRLTQGDFEREARYGDPAALAARYVEAGATWIHVVDLEAARTGVSHRARRAAAGLWSWPRRPACGCRPAAASARRSRPATCSSPG